MIKRFCTFICTLFFALIVIPAFSEEEWEDFSLGSTTYRVPSGWKCKVDEEGKQAWHYAQEIGSMEGGYLYAMLADYDATTLTLMNSGLFYQSMADAAFNDNPRVIMDYTTGRYVARARGHMTLQGSSVPVAMIAYPNGSDLLVFYYINQDIGYDDMLDFLDGVIDIDNIYLAGEIRFHDSDWLLNWDEYWGELGEEFADAEANELRNLIISGSESAISGSLSFQSYNSPDTLADVYDVVDTGDIGCIYPGTLGTLQDSVEMYGYPLHTVL